VSNDPNDAAHNRLSREEARRLTAPMWYAVHEKDLPFDLAEEFGSWCDPCRVHVPPRHRRRLHELGRANVPTRRGRWEVGPLRLEVLRGGSKDIAGECQLGERVVVAEDRWLDR
jgi:hypothetical protein